MIIHLFLGTMNHIFENPITCKCQRGRLLNTQLPATVFAKRGYQYDEQDLFHSNVSNFESLSKMETLGVTYLFFLPCHQELFQVPTNAVQY